MGSPLLTSGSISTNIEEPSSQLTAATLARFAELGRQSKAQLKTWRYTAERHEQVALGQRQKTSGSKVKTGKWLEEIEKKIEGTGTK